MLMLMMMLMMPMMLILTTTPSPTVRCPLSPRKLPDVRLVCKDPRFPRPVDPRYGGGGGGSGGDVSDGEQPHHTEFADGFPVLVVTEASMDDLNRRLLLASTATATTATTTTPSSTTAPVTVAHFRPNVVIAGCAHPYAEDQWKRIRLLGGGSVSTINTTATTTTTTTTNNSGSSNLMAPGWDLLCVKRCTRCTLTTVDPATGRKVGRCPKGCWTCSLAISQSRSLALSHSRTLLGVPFRSLTTHPPTNIH